MASRDPLEALLVHWGVLDPGDDPFLGGAYWAEATLYDRLFGDLLGPQFLGVAQLQRWSIATSSWETV